MRSMFGSSSRDWFGGRYRFLTSDDDVYPVSVVLATPLIKASIRSAILWAGSRSWAIVQSAAYPWFSDHVRMCARGGAWIPASLPRVCRACPTAWRWKSFIQPDGGEGLVKRKGCRREAGSEGSVEQSRDPTNRNRIRGLPGRTSGLATAKSSAIKDRGGRSGGCAVKAVELTSGDLRRVPASGTEGTARCPDRGAEVSRGHSRPGDRPKARTVPARG